jgi:hypothetical protein
MSAAATAAGYLYASGRLRGREKRPEGEHDQPQAERPKTEKPKVRVAAIAPREDSRPRRTPVVQYRTRRWRPEETK